MSISWNEGSMIPQCFYPLMGPLSNLVCATLLSPIGRAKCEARIVSRQSCERAACFRKFFSLSSEVANHRFTGAVGNCGDMKGTYSWLVTVKSQLLESQVLSKLKEGIICEHQSLALEIADLAIVILRCYWGQRATVINHHVKNEKPASWNFKKSIWLLLVMNDSMHKSFIFWLVKYWFANENYQDWSHISAAPCAIIWFPQKTD